jgi:chloramphenicol O-acetyltransferase type A
VATTCRDINDDQAMIIGTSAVVGTELDCIVNQYTGIFNNPFLVWGRYKRHWFKTTLTISLQFHHAQFDGRQAALFLERLQQTLKTLG